jgi:tetratricopeptide (TPR) repeat protein
MLRRFDGAVPDIWMERKVPMHFSELWLPGDNPNDVLLNPDDEADAIIQAALVDLHAGILEGDASRSAAARDGFARAFGLLEAPDRRFSFVLSLLAKVYLTWPGASDRPGMLDLAVQYSEAAAEAVLDDPAGDEFTVVTAVEARWNRYLRTRNGEDILAAAEYIRRLPDVPPDETFAAWIFANVLLSLYDHTSDIGALNMAVAFSRRIMGPGRTEAIGFTELSLVAEVLAGAHERRNEPGLLAEAVRFAEKALIFAVTPEARGTGLSFLADHRRTLYWLNGDPADLERAIQVAAEATQLPLRNAVFHAGARMSLALGLRARFEAFGDLDDLNEAIRLLRSIPSEAAIDNNYELSCALRLRFEAIGSFPDLNEALHLAELDAGQDGASANYLMQYSLLLLLAFVRTGDSSTLAKSIDVGRRAVLRARRGRTGTELAYHTLAVCLLEAHRNEQRPGLLDEAIEAIDEALALAASSAPTTATIQVNRAHAYLRRWDERGSPDDLEAALAAATDALARTEADHPDRAGRLRTFANVADAFARAHGDPSAREQALAARDEAIRSIAAPPDSRIRAAVAAGQALADDGRWQEANARFAIAVSLMPEVAWHGLDRSSQERQLTDGSDLPMLAAAHALQADDTVGAVDRLEAGRAVMWQHLLRLSDPSAVSLDSEAAGIVAELRRVVEVERVFREWVGSEDAADHMPREQVEELATDLGHLREPAAAAVVLGTLALRLRRTGDLQAAVATYLDAIRFAEAADDHANLGVLHGNLGFAYRQIGDQEQGIRHYRHSTEALRGSAPSVDVGTAHNNLGLALASLGRYKEAAPELAAAAANFAGVDGRRQANALLDLGSVLTRLDHLEDAMLAIRQSRKLFVELGDRRGHARTWYSEGLIHGRADRAELAIEALKSSCDLYELEDPERQDAETALERLGSIHLDEDGVPISGPRPVSG